MGGGGAQEDGLAKKTTMCRSQQVLQQQIRQWRSRAKAREGGGGKATPMPVATMAPGSSWWRGGDWKSHFCGGFAFALWLCCHHGVGAGAGAQVLKGGGRQSS